MIQPKCRNHGHQIFSLRCLTPCAHCARFACSKSGRTSSTWRRRCGAATPWPVTATPCHCTLTCCCSCRAVRIDNDCIPQASWSGNADTNYVCDCDPLCSEPAYASNGRPGACDFSCSMFTSYPVRVKLSCSCLEAAQHSCSSRASKLAEALSMLLQLLQYCSFQVPGPLCPDYDETLNN